MLFLFGLPKNLTITGNFNNTCLKNPGEATSRPGLSKALNPDGPSARLSPPYLNVTFICFETADIAIVIFPYYQNELFYS
ncbi:MAG: hypothetical protein QME75_15030 [Deltaproteobacteria bacterium]|nr:hypothetical protein [Deltaproteobacteria bacterium]